MIVFNKTPIVKRRSIISYRSTRERRRLSAPKRITKNNKDFLRALGFKVQNASNFRSTPA